MNVGVVDFETHHETGDLLALGLLQTTLGHQDFGQSHAHSPSVLARQASVFVDPSMVHAEFKSMGTSGTSDTSGFRFDHFLKMKSFNGSQCHPSQRSLISAGRISHSSFSQLWNAGTLERWIPPALLPGYLLCHRTNITTLQSWCEDQKLRHFDLHQSTRWLSW